MIVWRFSCDDIVRLLRWPPTILVRRRLTATKSPLLQPKAPGRSIALGRILIQAGAAKGFQIVFTLSIQFDRHLVCDPGE